MRKYRNYEDGLKDRLRDAEYAREYLSVALEECKQDEDIEAFLLAVRDVAEAQGGMSKLAERTTFKCHHMETLLWPQTRLSQLKILKYLRTI